MVNINQFLLATASRDVVHLTVDTDYHLRLFYCDVRSKCGSLCCSAICFQVILLLSPAVNLITLCWAKAALIEIRCSEGSVAKCWQVLVARRSHVGLPRFCDLGRRVTRVVFWLLMALKNELSFASTYF